MMAVDRFRNLFSALKAYLQNAVAPRWILLAAGSGCAIYSQSLLEQRITQGEPLEIAELWNTIYRLEIINYNNVLYALPYLIIALLAFALLGSPRSWMEDRQDWSSGWTPITINNWKTYRTPLLAGMGLFIFLLIQLGRHHYEPIFPFLWLVCLGLFTDSIWRWEKASGVDLSPAINPADVLWILLLLIAGFAIGSFALQDIPMIMIPDEGTFWETARAIALGNFHPPVFDSGVYTFPVASSIFQGWVLRVFGISFWSWRFSSVIAGVVTLIPLYLLARDWFGRTTAIASGVIMLANPYFISFARMGYNNSQSLFPVTLCVYFLALSARKGSHLYLWLAGLTAGLGFYTYSAAWLGLVTLGLGILHLWLKKQMQWKRALTTLGVIFLAWAAVFAPRLAFTASGEDSRGLFYKIFETSFVNSFYAKAYYGEADLLNTTPLFALGGKDAAFYDPVIYGELLLRGAVRTLLAIFDPFIISEHFLTTGLAGVITPVFFLIGISLCLRDRRQMRYGVPLIWLGAGLLFLSVIAAFPPRHTHLVSIIPALALISGVGLSAAANNLTELSLSRLPVLRSFARISLAAVALAAITYFGFQRYFVTMPHTYPPSFEDVASWIAWRNQEPVTLWYLEETQRPHRVEYLVASHFVPHRYKTSTISDFQPQSALTPGEPTIILIDSPQGEEPGLFKNPPRGFSTTAVFWHREEYIIGYAMTNTSLNPSPRTGAEDGLRSLTAMPVRNVLLLLMVLLVPAGMFGFRDYAGWPKQEFVFEIGKPGQLEASPEAGKPELSFHLRIRIPPYGRKAP